MESLPFRAGIPWRRVKKSKKAKRKKGKRAEGPGRSVKNVLVSLYLIVTCDM